MFLKTFLLPLLAAVLASPAYADVAQASVPTISVEPTAQTFIDSYKRTRVFHGMNAVYKIAPWYPAVTGFDSENTLSAIDAKNLKDWGFNVIRLGVMWPGVEPGARGVYDQGYLDKIETIVNNLAAEGIYTILDFHQDLWHRKFCGEGVPDYVYETCVAAEPEGTKPFPLPAVNATYPTDADGNPTLDACLSEMFATFYLSDEVGVGFQCLYDNVDTLWDAFGGYWAAVATRFANTPSVLGYELMNEPWAGDVYTHPTNLLPEVAEKKYLQPLYEHVNKYIRAVDDKKIIFFEGLTIDYWQNGFTQGPGGPEYNDRQAMAYHIYCPIQDPSVKLEVACQAINDEFFMMRRKDNARIGGGMIMTEFGAAEDVKADMYALEKTAELADKYQQSWMYWQFKYYQDITTCTPQGESMYQADGTVCEDKLRVLSRTYPHAVAGKISEYQFNPHTAKFDMQFVGLAADQLSATDVQQQTSLLYVNRALSYPHGLRVEVTGAMADSLKVTCPTATSPVIQLEQTVAVDDGASTTVTVTKCSTLLSDNCTCR